MFVIPFSKQTIGQAYEDMQTQNQHLLQLVADRDAYNIKVLPWSCRPYHCKKWFLCAVHLLCLMLTTNDFVLSLQKLIWIFNNPCPCLMSDLVTKLEQYISHCSSFKRNCLKSIISIEVMHFSPQWYCSWIELSARPENLSVYRKGNC